MKYFFDTEFIEDGSSIDLVSIGICAEDGREYYAISSEFDLEKLKASDWLMANVWPSIKEDVEYGNTKSRQEIARDIVDFVSLTHDQRARYWGQIAEAASCWPEFWANCGAYDWVALMQLFGPMTSKPSNFPFFCMDLQQYRAGFGAIDVPRIATGTKHNALDDARELKGQWEFLRSLEYKLGDF